MAVDQSSIDGLLFIADDELTFIQMCRNYKIRYDYSDSFEFRGTDPETQKYVTVIRRYGKFQKEADDFLGQLK